MAELQRHYDVVVIGAGFAGLGAALRLTERGAKVLLLERLTYPGGCASTFARGGYRFEAGATLFSGFAEGQLMHRWMRDHQLPVSVDFPETLIELRAPGWQLPIGSDREALVARFGDPRVSAFFAAQQRVAEVLWRLFDEPALLPPLSARALGRHALRLHHYLPLVRLLGRSLGAVLEDHGLAQHERLRVYLDALCQITVQTDAARAEAPFALAAIDYPFRGTGHVRGGIGALATALTDAVARGGGVVAMATRATALSRDGSAWRVETNRGVVTAPVVCANLLPRALQQLMPAQPLTALSSLNAAVEQGWGAAMIYMAVASDSRPPHAHHLQLVADPQAPFHEGNHVFCSISDARETERAPAGQRTVTVSTHLRVPPAETAPQEVARYIDGVHARMRETLAALAPELSRPLHAITASPRTFERFTGRPGGFVGGVPRTAGLAAYRELGPRRVAPGLWLIGDSVFPGQSTLATALGGVRTADAIAGGRVRVSAPAEATA